MNIEKGRSWAVETARAISMLDHNALDRPVDAAPEARVVEQVVAAQEPERLAA